MSKQKQNTALSITELMDKANTILREYNRVTQAPRDPMPGGMISLANWKPGDPGFIVQKPFKWEGRELSPGDELIPEQEQLDKVAALVGKRLLIPQARYEASLKMASMKDTVESLRQAIHYVNANQSEAARAALAVSQARVQAAAAEQIYNLAAGAAEMAAAKLADLLDSVK